MPAFSLDQPPTIQRNHALIPTQQTQARSPFAVEVPLIQDSRGDVPRRRSSYPSLHPVHADSCFLPFFRARSLLHHLALEFSACPPSNMNLFHRARSSLQAHVSLLYPGILQLNGEAIDSMNLFERTPPLFSSFLHAAQEHEPVCVSTSRDPNSCLHPFSGI